MKTVEGRLATSMMVLLLLLTVSPVLAVPVSEPQGTIHILADGNIDPLDAPIQRSGNLYVFINNALAKLVVSKNDIVIDGGEYTLEGNGTGIGISMAGLNNVTVRNTKVYGFEHGISLSGTHNKVYNNVAVDNTWIGIGMCAGSNNNTVYENRISGSKFGLWFCTSSNNTIYANIITGCEKGAWIEFSSNMTFSRNIFTANRIGVALLSSSNNTFFHNSFIDNDKQVDIETKGITNSWQKSLPSGGNYWDNYEGEDLYQGHHQNETGSDGIGDSAYIIDDKNLDRHPIMKQYSGPNDVRVKVSTRKTIFTQVNNPRIAITITTINLGEQAATFIFNLQSTLISHEETITLNSRSSTDFHFTVETTDLSNGNYTIVGYATPVQGETDLTDNTIMKWVLLTGPGDINGDFTVDNFDVDRMLTLYGVSNSSATYNPNLDIDDSGDIDIFDVVIVTANHGQNWQP